MVFIGEKMHARGFELLYHNHEFEFTQAGNPNGLEIILNQCAPERLGSELDVYWAAYHKFLARQFTGSQFACSNTHADKIA